VADQLYLSANTVRTHLRNLMAKLGVHSTLEAVALIRQGESSNLPRPARNAAGS
jgi:DNA-binding NarL/FixJ family response regulator